MIRLLRAFLALSLLVTPAATLAQMRFSNPSAGSAVTSLLQTGASSSHTGDTATATLATATIAAGTMGANGHIRVTGGFTFSGTAAGKTITVKLGSTTVATFAITSSIAYCRIEVGITNANATGAQVASGFGATSIPGILASNGAAAIDTTASTTVTILVANSSAADTTTLVAAQVLLYPHS